VVTVIDAYGLFGNKQITMDSSKIGGLVIIGIGIVVFKLKG
jgi:uncharacterized membrane protein YdcZ (DUF606 family)